MDKTTKRVFIPGCSLSSYNPELVGKTIEYLKNKLPGTGAILKCCGKPTKALGQYDEFKDRYASLQKDIDALGAEEIIVACQSCFLTMSAYSTEQNVRSLWSLMPEIGMPEGTVGKAKESDITFGIHDSCSTRDRNDIHEGVRWIIEQLGYDLEEPPHAKGDTRCCGFGGMVVPANPDLAQKIMDRRTAEFETDYLVTYCAACRASMYKGGKKAVHVLDLIFGDVWTSESDFPDLEGAFDSWVNRYKTKKKIEEVLS